MWERDIQHHSQQMPQQLCQEEGSITSTSKSNGGTNPLKLKVLLFQPCLILCDPMDCSPPSSFIYGILQAKYWRGFPFPPPGDIPDPVSKPGSPALQADTLPSESPGKLTNSLREWEIR